MRKNGFALLTLIIYISCAGDADPFVADCKGSLLYKDHCDACKGATFDSGLKDVLPCMGKTANGQLKKGVCFPKEDGLYVCKAACMYEESDVCANMVPNTPKEPAFLGIGDSCCKGTRPICCGRKDGRNYEDAICKQDMSLDDALRITGGEPEDIQACCHMGGRAPWPEDMRPHIIFKNEYYLCEPDKDGTLKKIEISKGSKSEQSLSAKSEPKESSSEDKSSKKSQSSAIYKLLPMPSLFFAACLCCFLLLRIDCCSKTIGYVPLENSVEEI